MSRGPSARGSARRQADSPLGEIGTREFLERYWQKEPLLVRGAVDNLDPLGRNALIELAADELVESRLVQCRDGIWHCDYGPFNEDRFRALEGGAWTLLVQAVDQWVPDVAALLERFAFLPRWRLDDVMVSYAATGGGIGPHFDYYDVFLLQAAGRRRWHTGARCDALTPLREHAELKLLERFEPLCDHTLCAGDMLYLPPGVGHQGTALDDECVTYSIGFRAPSHAELIRHAGDILGDGMPDHLRYRDAREVFEHDPFCIGEAVTARLRALWRGVDPAAIDTALVQAFGREVTEPRYPDLIATEQVPDRAALKAAIDCNAGLTLAHNPASRFAYRRLPDAAELYVDGEIYVTSLGFAQAVCAGRIESGALGSESDIEQLLMLLGNGSVHTPLEKP